MEKDVLLRITDYVVEFKTENGTKQAINHLNLTIHKGESLGLVGEAGAGKTTTALGVLRLLPKHSAKIKSGIIEFHGEDMAKFSERRLREIRGDKISMIFQNPLTSLNPVFTVGEQIAMVLRKHKNIGNKQAMEEAGKLMETVGIAKERINDYPHQFSGGMRQRIGIAAALACSPELLIADEPTTALDVTIQAQILELMKKLQKQYDTSLLMITHNLGIISELCRNVAVMYAGAIIEYGSVKEVFTNPMHPYTKGLLGAIPTLDDQKERLVAIPGEVANPYHLPKGCSFNPRCECKNADCAEEIPPMIKINESHYVSCFHCGEVGQ
ncbi:ABC transporter ATP-binding protein [Clostridium sp. AM33-3]|uniref:ABC transporter ATP-binding protein n=1 Tax=Clostridium sp. AM33-3 TaxID=2292304 RepID=UPI000E535319|nr:ABC transporter ATP-binding protein [Clostridium sp. AM33-3]RHT24151.1 ABC transporter ATP-binding protein [Clostridium sp. AM33-3]